MKYLIVGLGNIGEEYVDTRHNIGFKVVENIASKFDVKFSPNTLASTAEFRHKGKTIILIKPSTYMNLSGKAVRYYMEKEKIEKSNLFIVVDDLHIPYGTIRVRPNGSDAGHNGLKDITAILNTSEYPRVRVGIGSEFPKGRQVEFVLGKWNRSEKEKLQQLVDLSSDVCISFCLAGLGHTMNTFNSKKIEL